MIAGRVMVPQVGDLFLVAQTHADNATRTPRAPGGHCSSNRHAKDVTGLPFAMGQPHVLDVKLPLEVVGPGGGDARLPIGDRPEAARTSTRGWSP